MPEFLEVVESIRAEEASIQKLFGGEGRSARSGRRGQPDPRYMARLAEAAKFIADVYEGRRPAHHLLEAMTTSDFSNLFGDVIDRQLLASYRETPATFRNYCKIATVRDFRTVNRLYTDQGGSGRLTTVPEQKEYPEDAIGDGKYSYSVKKYGRRMPFSWETTVNDDLDSLKDVPMRFGRAARRTEEHFATGLFVDASGPHASMYTAGNANIVTSNPALSIAALQTAMTVLAAQTDSESEPIELDVIHLVVPPALWITANNILNALQMEITEAGGTSGQKLITANWIKNGIRLHRNSYIPIIATSNGTTSWFLFGDPNESRPAIEVGFLRGHTEPEVFVKESNARRVGGGGTDPMDGDFDTDAIQYKVRHVLGGSRMDPKVTVASNGSGS